MRVLVSVVAGILFFASPALSETPDTPRRPPELSTPAAPVEDPTPAKQTATPAPAQQDAKAASEQDRGDPAPSTDPKNETATPPSPFPPASEAAIAKARQRLTQVTSSLSEDDRQDVTPLAEFYASRNGELLWITPSGDTEKAAALVSIIRRADEWGLDPSDFDLPELTSGLSAGQREAADMRLSLAALKYARHARGGRIADPTTQLSSYLDRKPPLRDPKVVLAEISKAADPAAYLTGLHPQHPQFEKLRQAYLEMLQEGAATAEIVRLPKGPALVPGRSHPHVALLRKRLEVAAPADADGPADEELYDKDLVAAVREFQEQKGLQTDGIVGAGTRAALNDIETPNPKRLLANMEQWRWMPDDMGSFYVWVNVPEFKVRVVKEGKVVHEERVIAGLTDKQTPVFSDEMELVTLHPRWNVPNSIKVRELHPSLARGGRYFAKQNLRLMKNGRRVDPSTVNWYSADIRRYDVYQPPGGPNVLGVVKFSFPNKHYVYLHDTPTKHLFNKSIRTFSHGCVRVRNPVRLAELILSQDNNLTPDDIAEVLAGTPRKNPVELETKVPVHLTYFTAWVDDENTVQVAKDVYGHEERLTLALDGRFDEIDIGEDHLTPVKYTDKRYASGNTLETFMNNLFGGF
jgi:L,D-transpeptidase YcbB